MGSCVVCVCGVCVCVCVCVWCVCVCVCVWCVCVCVCVLRMCACLCVCYACMFVCRCVCEGAAVFMYISATSTLGSHLCAVCPVLPPVTPVC